MGQTITLGDLANQVAFEVGEQGPFNKQYYLYHLIQCAKKIAFDQSGTIKTVELEMGEDLCVQIPSDYVDWVAVGRREGNKVVTMTINPKLPLPSGLQQGTSDTEYTFRNFEGGTLQGQCGNSHGGGHFKEFREQNLLVFDSDVNAEYVYLEYITNGIATCGATLVHPYAEDTLLRYVDWQIARKKHGKASSETQVAKREYTNANDLLTKRLNSFTKKQYLEMLYNNYG